MTYLILIAFSFFGCSQDRTPPQSTPLPTQSAATGKIDMTVNPDGPKPVSRARLTEMWPALNALTEPQVQLFAEAVNIIPSPCAACGSLPMAHCFDRGQAEDCPVLTKLYTRATQLIRNGTSSRDVKMAINYPDVWFSGMGEGVPPTVTVYLDETGAFSSRTAEVIEELKTTFGDSIQLDVHNAAVQAPANLEVRGRPTWFINGHRFRGSQSPRILKRFIELEIADEQK